MDGSSSDAERRVVDDFRRSSRSELFFPALFGLLLSLPAGVVFLYVSIKNQERCAANCAGCMLTLFTVVIFCFPAMSLKIYCSDRDDKKETRRTIVALHCLSCDANAIFARLGRVPNDDAELVSLRGKSMPSRIFYANQGNDKYVIFGGVHKVWGYNDPWGVGLMYFGMNDAQRLRIDSGF